MCVVCVWRRSRPSEKQWQALSHGRAVTKPNDQSRLWSLWAIFAFCLPLSTADGSDEACGGMSAGNSAEACASMIAFTCGVCGTACFGVKELLRTEKTAISCTRCKALVELDTQSFQWIFFKNVIANRRVGGACLQTLPWSERQTRRPGERTVVRGAGVAIHTRGLDEGLMKVGSRKGVAPWLALE